jgi:hypothetical protein
MVATARTTFGVGGAFGEVQAGEEGAAGRAEVVGGRRLGEDRGEGGHGVGRVERQVGTPTPATRSRTGPSGFCSIRIQLGTPAAAEPTRPGPGRPKGSTTGPAPRCLLPGETYTPPTANTTLTRQR